MEAKRKLHFGDVVYTLNEKKVPCAYKYTGLINYGGPQDDWKCTVVSAEDGSSKHWDCSKLWDDVFWDIDLVNGKMSNPLRLCEEDLLLDYAEYHDRRFLDRAGKMKITRHGYGWYQLEFYAYQWINNEPKPVRAYTDRQLALTPDGLCYYKSLNCSKWGFRVYYVSGGDDELPIYGTKEECLKRNKVRVITFKDDPEMIKRKREEIERLSERINELKNEITDCA